MTPQQDRKLLELFDAALDVEPPERAAFAARVCAGEPALLQKLKAMLAADESARSGELFNAAGTPPRWPGNPKLLDALNNQTTQVLGGGQQTDGAFQSSSSASSFQNAGDDESLEPKPGLRLGQYELIRELGRGGMGAVFLARDTKLGRRVAIKFLQSGDSGLSERFTLEAQATARCVHENIVVIHDVKEFRGSPFMVLEYLNGQPLSKLLRGERLPANRALQLIIPVVRALVCAHEHKIVHRDLKPENIFMTDSGVIKVLDFGIAKFVYEASLPDPSSPSTTTLELTLAHMRQGIQLTSGHVLLGTLPYMSPEQWNASGIDHRTDLWAVGILLYWMLVGRHPLAPVTGHELAITALLDQPMPSAYHAGVDMPAPLADIIDRCLKKRKEERFASAKELLGALERLAPGRQRAELAVGMSPYTGLSAFQEVDANRFFGRAREIGTALARLHGSPLLGVVGPSGVGKSSFVRAGVIPSLKRSGEAWQTMVIRPGRHPMAALANLVVPLLTANSADVSDQIAAHQQALQRLYQEPGYLGAVLRNRARTDNRKLLLFVDQFEELFTLTPDVNERCAFTACLAGMADDALSPLRLMLSIRSDFLDRVAEDRQFMHELSHNLIFLAPPDREGLRDAILRPAEMVGYRFESVIMVEQMLDTLQTTPGCLPLLQFAASKLWEARDVERRLLTEKSYRWLGGVAGALATHADAVLTALAPKEQALVRTIFLQLVTPERTRAIASVAELCEITDRPDEVERLLSHLVEARLLVVHRSSDDSGGAMVEIVHESLISSWPRLAYWLDENQEDAVFLDQLRTAAKQWDSRKRPQDLLWRGETMEEARSWHRRYRGVLPPLQEQYLAAVFALADRHARMKRISVVGTMAFLIVLVAAAAVALVLIRDAERAAHEAKRLAEQRADEASEAAATIRKQYDDLQEAEAARQAALAAAGSSAQEANRSRGELALRNQELEAALKQADEAHKQMKTALDEAKRAQGDAERARAEAVTAKEQADTANLQLAEKLKKEAEETARLRERLRGKPITDLRSPEE